jgi:hypothetical protein
MVKTTVVFNGITGQYQYVIESGRNRSVNPCVTVGTIAQRDALTITNQFVLVLDASGDPSVKEGYAVYVKDEWTQIWKKVAEQESMNENIQVNWEQIIDRPNSSTIALDRTVEYAHQHDNILVLDGFSQDAMQRVTFNGTPLLTDINPSAVVLSKKVTVSGVNNVAGGKAFRIVGYNADTKSIVLEKLQRDDDPIDVALFVVGEKIVFTTSSKDPTGIFYQGIIASAELTAVDEHNFPSQVTVVLEEAPVFDASYTWNPSGGDSDDRSYAIIEDKTSDAVTTVYGEMNVGASANSTTDGHGNINVGEGSTVSGLTNVVSAPQSIVSGVSNQVYGQGNSVVSGIGNTTYGYSNHVIGHMNQVRYRYIGTSSDPTYADSCIVVGAMNEIYASYCTTLGYKNTLKATCSIAIGENNVAEEAANGSYFFGTRMTSHAPGATMIGHHGELPLMEGTIDKSSYSAGDKFGIHYKDAVVVAGGLGPAADPDARNQLAIVYSKYYWYKNPAYPWGTGQVIEMQQAESSEDPYILQERDTLQVNSNVVLNGVVYRKNRFKVVTEEFPELDADLGDSWKLTLSGDAEVTPVLLNGYDGFVGELVVYNAGTKLQLNADWTVMGEIPASFEVSGIDIFEIEQIDDLVFIRHKGARSIS